MLLSATTLAYALPLTFISGTYLWRRLRKDAVGQALKAQEIEQGLTEPASLHPLIDPLKCIGCGACALACPEKNVLRILSRKAELIGPTRCIGHGACKAACPEGAITLVFGTETRGVDIPLVSPDFETSVPGIFIAGELGGMGLIRNAVTQGTEAMDAIYARRKNARGKSKQLDVVIVGAGPAGLAASLRAEELGLSWRTFEQDTLGGTVAHYPRGKIVMTQPMNVPMVGKYRAGETRKEALISFWQDTVKKTGIQIDCETEVKAIRRTESGFEVETSRQTVEAAQVLLAIGRRGSPRKLGVPGEERTKVVYRLKDPEQYEGQHVLVVGGGDSALEAATTLCDAPNTCVTLSYRNDSFGRAKPKNRDRALQYAEEGKLNLQLETTVANIDDDQVTLETRQGQQSLTNDAVIICAGGVLPTGFLKEIGITVETKYGTA